MEKKVKGVDDGNKLNPQPHDTRGLLHRCTGQSMSTYGREVCFVLAAVFTAYAALHNSPLKTQKASFPKPFFPWNSHVHDYYLGNIQEAFEWVLESDLTFIMFYAPWDAASMDMRWEFDKTSKYLHHEVRFLAINCWWPEGECRNHFRPIQVYPVLMAFPTSGKGIQYRGPRSTVHMINFLENVMQPLKSIFTPHDLLHLQTRYNTVVVGYFDLKNSSHRSGFLTYYNTALKAIEKDLTEESCFAVISGFKMALTLGFKSPKSVHLFRFNESRIFPRSSPFRSDVLLEWVFKNHKTVIQWLTPPEVKSLMLSSIVETSVPVLIMFTPKNPLMPSAYYSVFHDVAYDYYNCQNADEIRQLIEVSETLQKQTHLDYLELKKLCLAYADQNKEKAFENEDVFESTDCCQSLIIPKNFPFSNSNKSCFFCLAKKNLCWKHIFDLQNNHSAYSKLMSQIKKLLQANEDVCIEVSVFQFPFEYILSCCHSITVHGDTYRLSTTSNGANQNDHNITYNYDGFDDKLHSFFEEKERRLCLRFHVANHYTNIHFPFSFHRKSFNITGLACKTNKTLKFIAMDTMQYETFANRLGLNVSHMKHKTAILIHNTEQEVQFLLKQMITKHNLMEFIYNYTLGNLKRFFRSSPLQSNLCQSGSNEICIHEITSSTFHSIVLDKTKDVVLLYYAPWCGFCIGFSHIYLMVAHYFQPLFENLLFARINGDWNDLPWEYNIEEYPAIIFFPSKRKAESCPFPGEMPLTFANLIYFILANIGELKRLHLALSLCTSSCIAYNRRHIVIRLQMLMHDLRILFSRHYYVQKSILSTFTQSKLENLNAYKKYLIGQIKQTRFKMRHLKHLQVYFSYSPTLLKDIHKETIINHYRNFKLDFLFEMVAEGVNLQLKHQNNHTVLTETLFPKVLPSLSVNQT